MVNHHSPRYGMVPDIEILFSTLLYGCFTVYTRWLMVHHHASLPPPAQSSSERRAAMGIDGLKDVSEKKKEKCGTQFPDYITVQQ